MSIRRKNEEPGSPDEPGEDAGAGRPKRAHLPDHRGDRESRMWQTLQAGQAVEFEKFEKKGMVGFGCPVCGRALWVRRRDVGDPVACDACGSTVRIRQDGGHETVEVVASTADPATAEGEKAVLPQRRSDFQKFRTGSGRNRRGEGGDEEDDEEDDEDAVADVVGEPEEDLAAETQDGPSPGHGAPGHERRILRFDESPKPAAAESRERSGVRGPQPGTAAPAPDLGASDASLFDIPAGPQSRKTDRFQPEKAPRLDALNELAEESMAERPEWWNLIDKEDESAAETVRRWSGPQLVMFGLLLIGVTFGVLFFLSSVAPPPPEVANDRAEVQQEVQEVLELGRELLDRTTQFLAATTLDGRAALVRNPERARPRLERYYGADEPIDDPLGVVSPNSLLVDQFEREGRAFAGVLLDFTDGSRRGVIFERTEDGWKLDWESFVGYSDVSLDAFAESPAGTEASIRVIFQSDDYYNYGYRDSEALACFLLEDPDRLHTMWAYCDRDSDTFRELTFSAEENAERGLDRAEAIVRLKIEDKGEGRRQAWIEAVETIGHLEL